jgi:sugar/nucleoside kinase (ribokinase family)
VSVPRVAVVGDVMLDVIVRPNEAISPTSDTPSRVRVTRGGSGANLAIALRASGCEVTYVGAAGKDGARDIFLDALRAGDVEVHLESVAAETGTVVALIGDDGQRAMLTDRGANSLLSEGFVLDQLAGDFDHVHVSGYLVLDPSTRQVAIDALRFARDRGRSTSVDVCSVGPLCALGPDLFLEAATNASQLFANEEEALALVGASDVETALDGLDDMFDEVVVTRGANGAVADVEGARFYVPSLATTVIDTTGAGDAATGTYLGARLLGEDPQTALGIGMAASARAVGEFGSTQPGM